MRCTKSNRGELRWSQAKITKVAQIAWQETYFGKDETVNVSVVRNITTITTRDRTTGKVDSKTFFGRTPFTSDFDAKK